MKASELLTKAKAVIEKPENWTKHTIARNSTGAECMMATNPRAKCWCSVGAIYTQTDDRMNSDYFAASGYLKRVIPLIPNRWDISRVTDFNDAEETTHADVMNVFDKAIALAISEGQ